MRIYEIARELDLPSREVLQLAQDLGLSTTSVLSGLSPEEADLVRASQEMDTEQAVLSGLSPEEADLVQASQEMDTEQAVHPAPNRPSTKADSVRAYEEVDTEQAVHPAPNRRATEAPVGRRRVVVPPTITTQEFAELADLVAADVVLRLIAHGYSFPRHAPVPVEVLDEIGDDFDVDVELAELPEESDGNPWSTGPRPMPAVSAPAHRIASRASAQRIHDRRLSQRFLMTASVLGTLLILANGLLRVSVELGIVAHGVIFAAAIVAAIVAEDPDDPDAVPAQAWLFASLILVPSIAFSSAAVRPIPDWAFPIAFLAPVGLAALSLYAIQPDKSLGGLGLADWRAWPWSLAAVPFAAMAAVTGFGEEDLLLGSSSSGPPVVRLVLLVFVALLIALVFQGIIQGWAEPLVGRVATPWIALVFASTFAASWLGLVWLLVFGLVLGASRTRFGSIWPGFAATAILLSIMAWL